MKKLLNYFTPVEKLIWCASVVIITASATLFGGGSALNTAASLIGVTSLIFIAKANPIGQALTVVFSLLYGIISFKSRYYGEMLTYLGMTMPMAVFALVTWLKHPFRGNHSQVEIRRMSKREIVFMVLLSLFVTLIFYFLLKALNTANLLPSTVSVTTSFLAVYLTFRRNPCYAAAYAANDIVLIILWVLAAAEDITAVSVVACFAAFFINDIYGFVNWRKIEKEQISLNS